MSVDLSTSQADAIAQYEQDLIDYLETQGIDASEIDLFTADGEMNTDLLNDETLAPYFQLAYLQLMEILDPSLINSLDGQVIDYQTVSELADPSLHDYILEMLADDPELIALFVSDPSEKQYLLEVINAYSSTDANTYSTDVTQDAWDLIDSNPYLNDTILPVVIEQEEAITAATNAIFDRLNDFAEAKIALSEALTNGDITSAEYEALMQEQAAYEQTLLAMVPMLQESLNNIVELVSKIEENTNETALNTVRNLR